jgi:hypothetical protein
MPATIEQLELDKRLLNIRIRLLEMYVDQLEKALQEINNTTVRHINTLRKP